MVFTTKSYVLIDLHLINLLTDSNSSAPKDDL